MYVRALIPILFLISCTENQKGIAPATKSYLDHNQLSRFEVIQSIPTEKATVLRMKSKEDTLFLESVDATPEEEKLFESDRRMRIESQYKTQAVPYPGALTHVSQCEEKFKPKKYELDTTSMHITAFEMFANDRFTFGSCAPSQIQYRGTYFMIYCRNTKKFFDLKLFFANHESDPKVNELIKDFRCLNP